MELPEDDVPPERYWHDEERISEWFDAVKQRREDKLHGMSPIDDEPDGPTLSNDYARELMQGVSDGA